MNMLKKIALVSTLLAGALWGQVNPNVSVVSNGAPFDGGGLVAPEMVTLILDGTADAGVWRTENTVWLPDGSPSVLGDLGLGAHDYTPTGGPGMYWLQFRLIDSNGNFQDQWVSFAVQAGYLVPNASVGEAGSDFILIQDAASSNGVLWTENVIWRPDGVGEDFGRTPLGALFYTPTGGSGQYWYQYRVVDNNFNFRDQWTPFAVP